MVVETETEKGFDSHKVSVHVLPAESFFIHEGLVRRRVE